VFWDTNKENYIQDFPLSMATHFPLTPPRRSPLEVKTNI